MLALALDASTHAALDACGALGACSCAQAKEAIYNRDTNEATEADKATAKLAQNGPYEGPSAQPPLPPEPTSLPSVPSL